MTTQFNLPELPQPVQLPQSVPSVPEPVRRKRLRFSVASDLVLLREAITHNPFGNSTKWSKVQEVMQRTTGKKFSLRCLRERVDRLVEQWIKGDTEILRRSGTDEQQQEKKLLLQVVADIRRKYKDSRNKLNQNRNDVRRQVSALPFVSPWNTHPNVQLSTSVITPVTAVLQFKQEVSPEPSSSVEQLQSPSFSGTASSFHTEDRATRDLSSPEQSLSLEPSSPEHHTFTDTEETFETSNTNAGDPLETSQHNYLATDHIIIDETEKVQKYRNREYENRKFLLEEKKLNIEEKKLALEEKKLAVEERKLIFEEKREEHRKALEEKRLQLEEEKLKMEMKHRQKEMEIKMEELKHRLSAEERQQDIIEILLLK